jgi:hypothetical protein
MSSPEVLASTFPHWTAQGELANAFRALPDDIRLAKRTQPGATSEGRILEDRDLWYSYETKCYR